MKKSIYIHVALIVLLGLFAYSNTFDVPFHFDDADNITQNPRVKDLRAFFTEDGSEEYRGLRSRYAGYLTFALNYHVHGADVRGYHIVNISIHIFNALLVYWFVMLTCTTPFFSKGNAWKDLHAGQDARWVALFSSLLFVSHPVQTQAVTYIVQRLASLATLWYLLSILLYVKARTVSCPGDKDMLSPGKRFTSGKWVYYAMSLLAVILTMKTKEIAFTLPAMIVLYEFLFLKGSIKKRILFLSPFLLTMLIIPLSLIGIEGISSDVTGAVADATRIQTTISRAAYFLTEIRVMVTYMRLFVLPVHQNLDYDYPVFQSFFHPEVLLSFACVLSVLGFGVYLLFRSRSSDALLRLTAAGIFWFFITLSVESSVIPIVDLVFEHRMYLPAAGACTALAAGIRVSLKKIGNETARKSLAVVALIIPIALSVAAYQRNEVWKSGVSLWEDVVRKSPRKIRGHNNLANAYQARGSFDEAIEHYLIALTLKPDSYYQVPEYFYAELHYNLATAYGAKGETNRAMEHYTIAITMKPDNSDAYNNLGVIYFSEGLIEDAITYYQVALRVQPDNYVAHFNLGEAFFARGMTDESIRHYRIFLRYMPDHAEAHRNVGIAYEKKGLDEEAAGHYKKAIELDPSYHDARDRLERLRAGSGQ